MLAPNTSVDSARRRALRAAVVLGITLMAAVLLAAVTLSPLRSGYADAPDRGPGDVELFSAKVARVRAGEQYYDVAADELRARGYPTRSIFNWRTPLPMWLIGTLPRDEWSKCLLGAAALALVLIAFALLHDTFGPHTAAAGLLALSGALLPCLLGQLLVMPEVWAGVLLALSAVSMASGRRRLGLAAAAAALVIRELAGLYVLVGMGLAIRGRRWRELAGWLLILAGYAVFYGWHLAQVLPRIGPNDVAHEHGWVRWGGAGFVISTIQMNVYLLLLPQWVTALYMATALLGFAAWRAAGGEYLGLTAAAYIAAFAVVGQPFNQYWGALVAPLFALGFGRGTTALMELLRTARGGTGMVAPRRAATR